MGSSKFFCPYSTPILRKNLSHSTDCFYPMRITSCRQLWVGSVRFQRGLSAWVSGRNLTQPVNVFGEECLHGAGHSAALGMRVSAIYTERTFASRSWSRQHHWHDEGSAGQEDRRGPPAPWYPVPCRNSSGIWFSGIWSVSLRICRVLLRCGSTDKTKLERLRSWAY